LAGSTRSACVARTAAARSQPAADLEAVDPGHHHVEHDQVERLLAEAGERLAAVGRAHDLVTVLAQRVAQQRLDGLLVVGQQDAQRAVGHGVNCQGASRVARQDVPSRGC